MTVSARLGGARADFVAGLGRKVADIKRALERSKASDRDPGPLEELQKRLKALGTSAKLMKFEAMSAALEGALEALERAVSGEGASPETLDEIGQLLGDLPALAWGDPTTRPVQPEPSGRSQPTRCEALVVGSPSLAEALGGELALGSTLLTLESVSTEEPQQALELARVKKPALIVLDADLAGAYGLVESLMDDPLTDNAPMVVVGSFEEASDSARYLALGVARVVAKPVFRRILRAACEAVLAPREALSSPPEADPYACADDTHEPLCESPLPGKTASLEEAVLEEILEHEPSAPVASLAAYAPTLVDGVVYAEKPEDSAPAETADADALALAVPVDVAPSEPQEQAPAESRRDMTPLPAVTMTSVAAPKASPRKRWSVFALFATTVLLSWGVAHAAAKAFVSNEAKPCELGASVSASAPPSKAVLTVAEEIVYTPITDATELAAGQGAIAVSAPSDAVVVVDGKEQTQGSTRIPASPGSHDVRIRRRDTEERGCTIDVRSSRTAHIKL